MLVEVVLHVGKGAKFGVENIIKFEEMAKIYAAETPVLEWEEF